MTYKEIIRKLNEAKPLEKRKVEEVKEVFNNKMEEARVEFQKQNKKGEALASQASFNR